MKTIYKNFGNFWNTKSKFYLTTNFINSQNYIKTEILEKKINTFIKLFLIIKYFVITLFFWIGWFVLLNLLTIFWLVSNNFLEYNWWVFLFNKVFLFYFLYILLIFWYFTWFKIKYDIEKMYNNISIKNTFKKYKKRYLWLLFFSVVWSYFFVSIWAVNYFFALEYIIGLFFLYLYVAFQVFYLFDINYNLYLKRPTIFKTFFSVLNEKLTNNIIIKYLRF